MDTELEVRIEDSGDFISITPIRWAHEQHESVGDWDRNWIDAVITAKGGAFSGSYQACFTTFDFENFKHDLNALYENLGNKIRFSDLEGYLDLKFEGDGSGNFAIKVICTDNPGIYSSQLAFELHFDQTYIKALVCNLNDITRKFPIVGNSRENNYTV